MKTNVKLEFHVDMNQRIRIYHDNMQQILKSEVAKGCEQYVPFDTGMLARSVEPSIDTTDPYLIYNTPYAAKQYYECPNKSPDVHPNATRLWFEVWKAANGQAVIDKIKKAVTF